VVPGTPDPDNPDRFLKPTCHTDLQALRISLVEYSKDGIAGKGRPAPPYAFIQIGDFVPDESWGATNSNLRRAPISVHYVDVEATGQKALNAKAFALQQHVDGGLGFSTFQSIEEGQTDSSGSNRVNQALAAESKVKLLCASVHWEPGLLVGGTG
jgi:hypothetical protein